jgi:tRNA threonylcarbamoyladenosine biosynthesis protein TsaB
VSGRWLAIDTATAVASVAVGMPPEAESVTIVAGPRAQAAQIVDLVDRALAPLGARPLDLAGIVIADGPGSFTGLRIGWAAAKGLAQERGLPLFAVPSLLAAATGATTVLGAVPVAVCFDALRGQVFAAMYIVHPTRVETVVAPLVCTPDELVARSPLRPRVAVGDGAMRYAADMERWSGCPPLPTASLQPAAVSLLALQERPDAGRMLVDSSAAEPEYGRPAEAQARWEARHGRPLPHPSGPTG